MKLLDKKEIDVSKAKERLIEVHEGKKLAEKVDQLRSLWADEEKRITVTRDAILASCKATTEAAINELERVKNEITYALAIKAEAEKPLIARSRALDVREEELAKNTIDLNDLVTRTELQAKRFEKAMEEAAETQKKADLFYEGAASINLEAQKAEVAAANKLREADDILLVAKENAKRIGSEVVARDLASLAREGAVLLKERSFADTERKLSVRERDIIDREESHAREVARSKK